MVLILFLYFTLTEILFIDVMSAVEKRQRQLSNKEKTILQLGKFHNVAKSSSILPIMGIICDLFYGRLENCYRHDTPSLLALLRETETTFHPHHYLVLIIKVFFFKYIYNYATSVKWLLINYIIKMT
jgi:hypothetical protein